MRVCVGGGLLLLVILWFGLFDFMKMNLFLLFFIGFFNKMLFVFLELLFINFILFVVLIWVFGLEFVLLVLFCFKLDLLIFLESVFNKFWFLFLIRFLFFCCELCFDFCLELGDWVLFCLFIWILMFFISFFSVSFSFFIFFIWFLFF